MNFRLSAAYVLTLAVSVAVVPVSAAQALEDEDAPRFVVRISRPFLAQFMEKHFVREEPVNDVILGALVEGTAQVDGRFSVKLQEDNKIEGFNFLVHGQVSSRTIGRRGRIVVNCEGHAQFNAVRPVTFTGKEFVGQPVTVAVAYHSQMDGITTRRGGSLSRMVSRIAYPSVMRSMPEADRISESKLRDHLSAIVTHDSDEMLLTLNRVTGVAATLVLLQNVGGLPGKDLPLQLAASDQYLIMGMAAHEQALADLPVLREEDRAPMEVWVPRLTNKKQLNLIPGLRPFWLALRPLLKISLSTATEVAESLDYIHVTELENWRVIRLYPNPVKSQEGAPIGLPDFRRARPVHAPADKSQGTSVESKSAVAR